MCADTWLLTYVSGIVKLLRSPNREFIAVYGDVARCAVKYRDKIFAYDRIAGFYFAGCRVPASRISSRCDAIALRFPPTEPHPSAARALRASVFLHASRVCDRSRDSFSVFLAPYHPHYCPLPLSLAVAHSPAPPIEITSERPRRS